MIAWLTMLAMAAGETPVAVARPLPESVPAEAFEAALALRGARVVPLEEGEAVVSLEATDFDGLAAIVVRVSRDGRESSSRVAIVGGLAGADLVRACALLALEAVRDPARAPSPPPAPTPPAPLPRPPAFAFAMRADAGGSATRLGESSRHLHVGIDGGLRALPWLHAGAGLVVAHQAPGRFAGDPAMNLDGAIPGALVGYRAVLGARIARGDWRVGVVQEIEQGIGEPVLVGDQGRVRAREQLVTILGSGFEVRSPPMKGWHPIARATVRIGMPVRTGFGTIGMEPGVCVSIGIVRAGAR